jgi:hypothetical protein
MRNLRVVEPEGAYTPDQVSTVLAMNLLLNGDAPSLRDCVKGLVPKVPLKHQKVLKAFLAMDDSSLLESVNEFIAKVEASLAQSIQEKIDVRLEECVVTRGESHIDADQLSTNWGNDDWDRSGRSKPSTRGLRAVRAAKRGQAEA